MYIFNKLLKFRSPITVHNLKSEAASWLGVLVEVVLAEIG